MAYKKILIAGSVAFDFIFTYEGLFQDHFKEQDLSNLSTCFFATKRKKFFGGCGGNIAYTYSLFGDKPFLISAVGSDFEPDYRKWLFGHDIDLTFVKKIKDGDTACAYIATDKQGNQLTIFYPGATIVKQDLGVDFKKFGDCLLSISPMNLGNMIELADDAAAHSVDYIFDPGQQVTLFSSEIMSRIIENAYLVVLNEYEYGLAKKKVNMGRAKRLIVTKGEKGSEIIENGMHVCEIPAIQPSVTLDPTGCGDAYRGGLLHGLKEGLTLRKACEIGALAAAYNIEKEGTQNHKFDSFGFQERLAM